MKRTLSDELLPTPSQQPQSELTTATLPNTTAEQTRSEPTLLNRTAVNPSIEMVTAVNQPPIQPSEHSTPEKSDRSSSASSSVSSATTDDEITLLQKAAWSGDAESQFRLGKCYISGKGVEINNEYALMWFTKADLQNHKEAEIVMKTASQGLVSHGALANSQTGTTSTQLVWRGVEMSLQLSDRAAPLTKIFLLGTT